MFEVKNGERDVDGKVGGKCWDFLILIIFVIE